MIPSTNIQRSVFDRSHGYKTTLDAGLLVPFFVDEVLPGDTFNLSVSMLARLATPIVPFMDNVWIDTQFFFVPNRLVWDHWEEFNGASKKGIQETKYQIPQIEGTNVQNLTVWDYFGLPTNVTKKLSVSALPFRAYQLIYNEWYRDENLIEEIDIKTDETIQNSTAFSLLKRGKRHDYFTSALPWPQKGPGVEINIGGYAPVNINAFDTPFTVVSTQASRAPNLTNGYGFPAGTAFPMEATLGKVSNTVGKVESLSSSSVNASQISGAAALPTTTPLKLRLPAMSGQADLSTATPISINDLRQAFQVQRLYERDARGGTRYTEILRAHFNVISPDARLQRPEFLGGSSTRVDISQVAQTSSTDTKSPQGNLAAFGIAGDRFHGFTKSFVEHGYIIGIVSIRADLTYQQGINRMWSRKNRFDFYWPSLAHLGEQAILNKEIFAQGTAADDSVFGYQERYAEYRYKPSQITGKLRSTDPQSLDVWHLAQKFESLPTLNRTFIEENPPIDRVIAVQDEPQFILDCYFKLKTARPMPVYGTPGLIDHF
nr:MAG: major capsid protein [Microviridae sp.]